MVTDGREFYCDAMVLLVIPLQLSAIIGCMLNWRVDGEHVQSLSGLEVAPGVS